MRHVLFILLVNLLTIGASHAQVKSLFDVEARRAALAQPAMTTVRAACLAVPRDPAWAGLRPVDQLKVSESTGADGAVADFTWAVMVLTGRALAGDTASEASLRDLLLAWARAKALERTEAGSDAEHALKRALLPTVAAYSVLHRGLDEAQRQSLAGWISSLVRRIDRGAETAGDGGSHGHMAASILIAWGAATGDDALHAKGYERYRSILAQARSDGSLAPDVRRGARALWFTRQTLASLTVMAEVAATRGADLYGIREGEANFDRVLSYLLNAIAEPNVVMAYASEGDILGGELDFRRQELGFLSKRGNGRHLMAWAEPVQARDRPGLATRRLKSLYARSLRLDRPLIDEAVGGNATCFWGR